jgi:ferric-chelate reductase [NAD(P)H]
MTNNINLENIDTESLYKIQYGMYLVSTKFEEIQNAQIATAVFQVSAEPIQIAVGLSKNTYTHELTLKSKKIGVSILEQETPMVFIGNFGYRCGRTYDKFNSINCITLKTDCPIITDHSLVALELDVKKMLDIGTHTIFIGEVLSAKKIKDGVAMTYEYYHTVVKGKSPENAPTHQKKF